jgi:hypothetical protein
MHLGDYFSIPLSTYSGCVNLLQVNQIPLMDYFLSDLILKILAPPAS